MASNAMAGALLGLFAGLLIGIFIRFIGGMFPPFASQEGPHQIAPFLGMGFGTVIGALLGGMVGLKNK